MRAGLLLGVSGGVLVDQAFATCTANDTSSGSGPPSISATETSTAEILEIIRKRQEVQVAAYTPDGGTAADTAGAPAGEAAAAEPEGQGSTKASSGDGTAKSAKSSPKPVYRAHKVSSDVAGEPPTSGSVQNGHRGAWVQAYGDVESNSDVNIGPSGSQKATALDARLTNVTARSASVGTVAGMDWSHVTNSAQPSGVLFGFFGGYNYTDTKFTDGAFASVDKVNGSFTQERWNRTDADEQSKGTFWGFYGTYFRDHFMSDLTLKADFNDLEHSHVQERNTNGCGGKDQQPKPALKQASADVNDYTVASNLAYRFDLGQGMWWAPTVGLRFIYSDFSDQSGDLNFASVDGKELRVQGGVRFGRSWVSDRGHLWTTAFGLLLYNDVYIDGYVSAPPSGSHLGTGPTLNDEGKLRVAGEFATKVDLGDGYSVQGQVEVRGGDSLIGVGGLLGLRYEW